MEDEAPEYEKEEFEEEIVRPEEYKKSGWT